MIEFLDALSRNALLQNAVLAGVPVVPATDSDVNTSSTTHEEDALGTGPFTQETCPIGCSVYSALIIYIDVSRQMHFRITRPPRLETRSFHG